LVFLIQPSIILLRLSRVIIQEEKNIFQTNPFIFSASLRELEGAIAREQSVRFALRLIAQQGIAAISFSVLLAWGGILIGL
jgi:hypothetical protein